jgi:hypothetical protein
VVPPDAITVQIGAPDVIVMLPVVVAWLVLTVQLLLELNCDPVKFPVIVVPAMIPIPFSTAPVTIPLPVGVFVTVNVVPVMLPVKLVLVLPNVNDMNPYGELKPCPKISPNVCGNYTEPLYQYDVCG